jgi:hypothetical protein
LYSSDVSGSGGCDGGVTPSRHLRRNLLNGRILQAKPCPTRKGEEQRVSCARDRRNLFVTGSKNAKDKLGKKESGIYDGVSKSCRTESITKLTTTTTIIIIIIIINIR